MEETQGSETKKTKSRRGGTWAFPKNTLNEALKVPEAIRDQNAGKPFSKILLAEALKLSPTGGGFNTIMASAKRYALIETDASTGKTALTRIGESIVYPRSKKEQLEGLKSALYSVDLFRKFFEKYDDNKVPEKEILKNVLHRDYGIPVNNTERCYQIIMKVAKELELIKIIKGSRYINMAKFTPEAPFPPMEGEEETGEEPLPSEATPPVEKEPLPPKWEPLVFIAHSKNKTILDQIKQILDFGQFKYFVAEEIPVISTPIPDKIFGLMRKCNCGLINVSADEQEKKSDGTYGINQNVLIEIGGAFLKYDRRVILLVDNRVELPSNLQGLSKCKYEGKELTFSAFMELQKTLQLFRKHEEEK